MYDSNINYSDPFSVFLISYFKRGVLPTEKRKDGNYERTTLEVK